MGYLIGKNGDRKNGDRLLGENGDRLMGMIWKNCLHGGWSRLMLIVVVLGFGGFGRVGLCADGSTEVESRPLFSGVTLKKHIMEEPRPVRISVLEIDLEAPGIRFLVSPSNDESPRESTLERTRDFVDRVGAQAGMNATFFFPWPSSDPYANNRGLVASAGDVYSPFEDVESKWPVFHISESNRVKILARGSEGETTEVNPEIEIYNAVSGSERLVKDGKNVAEQEAYGQPDELHPRSVAGVTEDRRLLLATIDGRQPGYSEGMRNGEVADFLIKQGVIHAVNLDGGGSSTLVVADPEPRVVNQPSGRSERKVGASIAVYAEPLEEDSAKANEGEKDGSKSPEKILWDPGPGEDGASADLDVRLSDWPKDLEKSGLLHVVEDGRDLLSESERAVFDSMREALYKANIETADMEEVKAARSLLEEDGTFRDLGYEQLEDYGTHVERLEALTFAYLDEEGSLAGDAKLWDELVTSLDWWLTKDYIDSNWWKTFIGFPRQLSSITTTLGPDLNERAPDVFEKLIHYYYRVHAYFLVNPRGGGANVADMSYLAALGAIMDYNPSRLGHIVRYGFKDVIKVYRRNSSEDGWRKDGTFFAHGPQLHNATYGHEYINSILAGVELLRGTPWDIGNEAIRMIEWQLLDAVGHMVYGDFFDFNAMGRGASRKDSHEYAKEFQNDIERVLALGSERADELRMLHREIGMDKPEITPVIQGARSFWYSDFITNKREDYYTSVRMVSDRTYYSESGNGEGIKHRYFGDGINLVLVRGDEYDGIQPLWNYERLPGLTAEQDGTVRPEDDWGVPGKESFAGSVSDGRSAVAAMRLDHDGVSGLKSWFLFDHAVVAVGSDICAPDSSDEVFTTLNQSLIEENPVIGWMESDKTWPENGVISSDEVSWAWQPGIGYVFLDDEVDVRIEREDVTADWTSIGVRKGRESGNVFSVSINHGIKPAGAGYAYSILPGVNRKYTRNFASNPSVEVLAQTSGQHAVYDHTSGQVGAVFFRGGEALKLPDGNRIEVDVPLLVMVDKRAAQYVLSIADPLQEEESVNVTVELSGETETFTFDLPGGDLRGAPFTQEIPLP